MANEYSFYAVYGWETAIVTKGDIKFYYIQILWDSYCYYK